MCSRRGIQNTPHPVFPAGPGTGCGGEAWGQDTEGGVWPNCGGPSVPPEFPRCLTLHTGALCSFWVLNGFFSLNIFLGKLYFYSCPARFFFFFLLFFKYVCTPRGSKIST